MADCFTGGLTDRLMLNLIIQRIPGLRIQEKNMLSQKFENMADFLALSVKDIEAIVKRQLNREKWTMEKIKIQAESDYKTAKRQGIKIVSVHDPDYPPLLREIYDPPSVLFYRGVLPNPEIPLVAMVGTRKPSSAAVAKAYELGRDLGRFGIPVVSGLALGIDAFSHRGNIDAGAPSVAVLGSGLDQIYPSSNRQLALRILKGGGALISEYPPEMGPRKWHFPARNRIISALARGTIIVEAPKKSGALITAEFALDQDRDLWVSSVGLNIDRESGTAKLALDGAKVINSSREILEEWGLPCDGFSRGGQPENTDTGFGGNFDNFDNIEGSVMGASLASSLARTLEMELRGM